MAGDVRSFVVLALLALLVFVIYRYLHKVLTPYQGYIRFMAVLLVGLAVYTWVAYPDRMAEVFNGVVDWITERVEPLIAKDDDPFLD